MCYSLGLAAEMLEEPGSIDLTFWLEIMWNNVTLLLDSWPRLDLLWSFRSAAVLQLCATDTQRPSFRQLSCAILSLVTSSVLSRLDYGRLRQPHGNFSTLEGSSASILNTAASLECNGRNSQIRPQFTSTARSALAAHPRRCCVPSGRSCVPAPEYLTRNLQ